MTEAILLQQIRSGLNSALDEFGEYRVRLFRNSVGFDMERKLRFGQPGSPDLWGPLRKPLGVWFGCEVKLPGGRISAEQKSWWTFARAWGIRGGVAHSLDEAMALLSDAERCVK